MKGGIDLCMSGCLHADKWSVWWPGCLGFLGRQCQSGGARWQAPKPDLHSILRANFTAPDAPPMPSTDTRESRGKQEKGAWKGGLKSRGSANWCRRLPLWSCYSPRDLPFRCPMTGSACPTNPCYMRAWGWRAGTVQVGGGLLEEWLSYQPQNRPCHAT